MIEDDEIKEIFNFFDDNQDGAISVSELAPMIRTLGQNPTEAELVMIRDSVDKDENGELDFAEFKTLISKFSKPHEQVMDDLREAFSVFDRNRDGYIDPKELRQVLTTYGEPLSQEDVDTMIKMVDENNDNRLNFEEFVKLMTNKVAF